MENNFVIQFFVVMGQYIPGSHNASPINFVKSDQVISVRKFIDTFDGLPDRYQHHPNRIQRFHPFDGGEKITRGRYLRKVQFDSIDVLKNPLKVTGNPGIIHRNKRLRHSDLLRSFDLWILFFEPDRQNTRISIPKDRVAIPS